MRVTCGNTYIYRNVSPYMLCLLSSHAIYEIYFSYISYIYAFSYTSSAGQYTDQHAGSGYTIQYRKREIIADSIRLPMHTTFFQAEIIAINEACKNFINTNKATCNI